MILPDSLAQELKEIHKKMDAEGKLLSKFQLDEVYKLFRQKFGPEVLSQLEGEELLEVIHSHNNRDSLVYWLEFKHDEEFPDRFGGIGGGSALKFGIYKRRETGAWMAGSPGDQRELSKEEALAIAKGHRDQLLAGVALLEKLPTPGTNDDYATLQEEMNRLVLSNTAWGHKYFSLLFPDKLDDYHNPLYQRFHLIRLLQKPASEQGRYSCAGQYVAIAQELNFPINHLTTILNVRDGRPHRYWRIGTRLPQGSIWELMRDQSCVAVGWAEIGSLADINYSQESKEKIRTLLNTHYPGRDPGAQGRAVKQLFNFASVLSEGDLVVPSDGMRVLGVGRISGPYAFESEADAPHRRPVDWLWLGEYPMPIQEGLRTTVYELKIPENLIEIETRLLGAVPAQRPQPQLPRRPSPLRLSGIPGRIQAILERKSQVILYGPPGTGKTYLAEHTAWTLASYTNFGTTFEQLSDEQRKTVCEDLFRMCTFHPAYGYEDFLEGYRPQEANGQLVFERRDGVFKELCEKARKSPERSFYLVIDEINRGDIPRIFGELLTVLEKDKRGKPIVLPLSGPFTVPDNIFVIGTMNTADRSIALLDKALRRRFGFVELMPDSSVLEGAVVSDIPLGVWLDTLNQRLCDHLGRDARNLQIGHAYLLEQGRPVASFGRFARILQDDILPLLEEYCYEDFSTLGKILGGLVDDQRQRIRQELFEPAREDELVQVLLSPEVVTSMQAAAVSRDLDTVGRDEDEGKEDVPA